MLKVYSYQRCSTCRNAIKYLSNLGVEYREIDIITNRPTRAELERMLKFQGGNLKALFNSSGELYRELNIKDKLPAMSKAQAFDLLSKHGKLIKRPFVIGSDIGLVGFRVDEWDEKLSSLASEVIQS